jgi:hypothetical protein
MNSLGFPPRLVLRTVLSGLAKTLVKLVDRGLVGLERKGLDLELVVPTGSA